MVFKTDKFGLICKKTETGRNDRNYNRFVSASRALNLVREYAEKRGRTNEEQ